MKRFYLCFSLITLFLTNSCAKTPDILTIDTPKQIPLVLEIADDDDERKKGLMFRNMLRENHGMIFVFPHEHQLSFWMKNTPLPLSIAFVGKNGVVINIEHMIPYSLEIITSKGNAQYAIEVERGLFSKLNIYVGTALSIPKWLVRQAH